MPPSDSSGLLAQSKHIAEEIPTFASIKIFVGVALVVGAWLISGTAWVVKMSMDESGHDRWIEDQKKEKLVERVERLEHKNEEYDALVKKRETQWQAVEEYKVTTNRALDVLTNVDKVVIGRVDKNEARLDRLQPIIEYMDWMRDWGMSNKEDFFKRHGYMATTMPGGDLSPNMPSSPSLPPPAIAHPPKQR